MATLVAVQGTRWNTLRLMRGLRFGLLGLDLFLLTAVMGTARANHEAAQAIGQEAEPAVATAQQVSTSLARMDAAAADELAAKPGAKERQGARYEAERARVVHGLIDEAEQANAAAGTKQAVEVLELGLGRYEQMVQQARDTRTAEKPSGSPRAYTQAAGVMDKELLPAARALGEANSRRVEAIFRAQRMRFNAMRAVLLAVLALSLAVLGFAQVMLGVRTRRVLNLPLLVGTLFLVSLGAHFAAQLGRAEAQLRVASTVDFPVLQRLWASRMLAAEVADAQSRGRLGGAPAVAWKDQAASAAAQMATLPPALSAAELTGALREGRDVPGFAGALADVLTQVKSAEQREPGLTALTQWEHFLAAEQRGGTGSAAALQVFGESLDQWTAQREAGFEAAVAESLRQVTGTALQACLGAVLLGALVVLGFMSRIREYR